MVILEVPKWAPNHSLILKSNYKIVRTSLIQQSLTIIYLAYILLLY